MAKLSVHHIARIEGHGNISVEVENGIVKDITLDVVEPARVFESMVVGRSYEETALITSRICGICSPNHFITELLAVEDALDIQVSERTKKLRQLLVYGSYLQNHATALYILAAPDFVKLPSFIPLLDAAPEVVQRALRLKKLGNDLCTVVGGRPVHPINPCVGGFSDEPTTDELSRFSDLLGEAIVDAAATVEFFGEQSTPRYDTEGEMLALKADDVYAITSGQIGALKAGWRKDVNQYQNIIKEGVVAHGNSKHALVEGKPFMTGPLARVNISWDQLLPSARVVASKVGLRPVNRNIFNAHLCRAIELVDAVERCSTLAAELAKGGGTSAPEPFEIKAGKGYGATEAPRGTLYHSCTIGEDGIVTAGDVITPTAQNLANIEVDMRAYAPTVVDLPEEDFKLAIEMLVRAYDPCLSCAVH